MSSQRKTQLFSYLVIALGSAACFWSALHFNLAKIDYRFWLLSSITVFFSSRLIVKIPKVKGEITVSDTFLFLTMLLFGAEAAVLLATIEGMVSARKVSKTVVTLLFNTAMMSFSTFTNALICTTLIGPIDLVASQGLSGQFVQLIALMAFLQYVLNSGLAAIRTAFRSEKPIIETWVNAFLWTSITYFAGASTSGLIALINQYIGFHAIIITTPIIAIVYFTYRTYLKNVEASQSQAELAQRHVEELSKHIAEQERISRALKESEEHFRSAFDQAAGMALVNQEGKWLQVNQSLCRMLDASEEELLNHNFQDITHPDDLGRDLTYLYELVEGKIQSSQNEKRYVNKRGEYLWVLQSASLVRDSEGRPQHFIFQIQDITERKHAEEKIHHAAFHDALTGLPNRILLSDRLSLAVERAKRNKEYQFAVLFIDLDRFKIINDSLGHQYGDILLIDVAKRLRNCVRAVDTVARLGGDEFAILLDGVDGVTNATHTADRIQELVSSPFNILGEEVFISASIGIAYSTSGYEKPEDILRDSDTAMYRAKSNGKARHEVFDQAMHTLVKEQLEVENDLRRAIDREEIEIYYQPIISIATTEITGFEALARWNHPLKGFIPPSVFIGVAEETGLILPLGLTILRKACKQTAEWQKLYGSQRQLTISVNLSPRQLKQPSLVEEVELILEETGLKAENLRLEVTESLLMENPDAAKKILERLKSLGLQLSLDDFGTGYSSLSYLHQLPFDILKIDRSFVSRLGKDSGSAKIIKTILLLAAELEMQVVAEGIETAQQHALLQQLHCGYGQGFLFYRPLTVTDATAQVQRETQNTSSMNEFVPFDAPELKIANPTYPM